MERCQSDGAAAAQRPEQDHDALWRLSSASVTSRAMTSYPTLIKGCITIVLFKSLKS